MLFIAESLARKPFYTISFNREFDVFFSHNNPETGNAKVIFFGQNQNVRVVDFKAGLIEDRGELAGVEQSLGF